MSEPVPNGVPRGPVEEKSHGFFINKELLPLLQQMRARVNFALRYDVTDFGARPGVAKDQGPSLQGAIDAAAAAGRDVYIPAGIYRIETPIDLNGVNGLNIYGDGIHSRLDIYTGAELFCCVGAVSISWAHMYILAPQAMPATAAFLMGRVDVSSSGTHVFYDVTADGWYTHATEVCISSESNVHTACKFGNRQPGDAGHPKRAWVVSCTPQNDTDIVPTYGTLANPQVGGNTDHHYTDCAFTRFGDVTVPSNGGCVRLGGRTATFNSCFWTVRDAGYAGLWVFDTPGLTLTGGMPEVDGADHAIVLEGVISSAKIDGAFTGAGLYGVDGSRLSSSAISGFWSATPGINLYDAENCEIRNYGTTWQIRRANYGNNFPDSGTVGLVAGGTPTFVNASTNGMIYRLSEGRSDGNTIHTIHVGDVGSHDGGGTDLGSNTRVELGQSRAYVFQRWQSTFSTVVLPAHTTFAVRSGSVCFCTLDQNITLDVPTDVLLAGASTKFDIGVEYTVVFKNTGAFTVTLGAGFAAPAGWAVGAGAGVYTRFDVVVLADGTHLGS